MAEQTHSQDQKTTEAPAQTQPAEEWGQREDHGRTVAAGGKESEKAPGGQEQRP